MSLQTHHGSCHCGKVEYQVDADLGSAVRCDCSLCQKKSATMVLFPLENFTLLKGKSDLSLYQWATNIAEHYFCSTCGIYTHHKLRSKPGMMGINAGTIDDVNPIHLDFKEVFGSNLPDAEDV